jgi:hypothetical protein
MLNYRLLLLAQLIHAFVYLIMLNYGPLFLHNFTLTLPIPVQILPDFIAFLYFYVMAEAEAE